MAKDNRRSRKVKDDENIKPKKKTVTKDASPASKSRSSNTCSSRRLSRETSSSTKTKENPYNTRKSKRLEKRKASNTSPIKDESKKKQKQMITTPIKMYDRRKKKTSLVSLKSKKIVEESESSNMKLKMIKVELGLKCVNDTSEDERHEEQGLDAGGRKRKRDATCINKDLSKPQQIKTEAGDDSDEENQEKSSQANSSSSRDVDTELEKPDKLCEIDNIKKEYSGSKSVEDKEDSDDECSDRSCSKKKRTNHGLGKKQEPNYCDTTCNTDLCDTSSSKDRTCEAPGLAEIVDKNNGVSRTGTSICTACKLGGNLRYCDAAGCNRCFHLSCLDPPVDNVPLGYSCCPLCVKNIKSSVPLVSRVAESIWDTREVEVSDAQGLQKQKQKQYFVKYKGLAHIYNQWVTETQLLLEAPLLVENFSKNGSMKWTEEWTAPHQLLKKRLLLSLKPSQQNTGKVLNYHYEWLVKWQGLDSEQATWESESIPLIDSPEGHNLITEYEKHHKNAKISASSDDKIEEMPVKLPTLPAGCPPGMDSIHLGYVKNLHDAWNKGQKNIVFDDQERTMRIVLFMLSLKGVTLPFLLITTSGSISQWEAMFLKIAPFNAFKVSLEATEGERSSRLLEVHEEGGQLAFQVLLYPVDAFVKDLNVLKPIKWEAVIVDESQSSEISAHFSHVKSLSTDKRLLVLSGPLGVSMTSYLDVLSLLDCVISKTELDDVSKLKETLYKFIAYECKSSSSSSKFVEFWVPVQISNMQLEKYCSTLLSNAMALSSYSKSDTVGALHDILVSNRKCCDHPYIVDQSLQGVLTKGLEPAKFLDVGIKASGKLQFLDLILPEMRKRQLRLLILFQPLSGSGKDSTSVGDILDDFVRQRFGEDSYERVDGIGSVPSKKQAALNNFNNKDKGRFIFLLEYRACLPSIKLSSVDTIFIFDSDWNPANDLRALQKIAIDSQSEQIMIFRLYTSSTLEEKILRLAEHNVTIDSKLQNLSRSTSDALLMWGATYLFNKLDEFHHASVVNMSSEECMMKELKEEFLNLICHKHKNNDTTQLIITRVQPNCGTYGKNLTFPSELITQLPDGQQPHTFWRKLLMGRNPCWKYLSTSASRQRKRPQYFESPPKTNAENDDVGRKRKKNANNITEPVASKPAIEECEIAGESTGVSTAPSHDDAICNETSFRDLLKLQIYKLCEVLRLSEDVKIMVERFLEYVIDNYRVNKEPANTLHAFLISLCWIGSELLKQKLDMRQSIALAIEHLSFSCKEEEANSVYLKLEPAKENFLSHTEKQKKTDVSKDSIPAAKATSMRSLDQKVSHSDPINLKVVKVDILESSHDQCVEKSEHHKLLIDTSDALVDQNDSSSPSAAVSKEKVPSVQPSVSPASVQDNEVQGNPRSLAEISNLQTLDAGKVGQLNPETSSLPPDEDPPVAENQFSPPPQVLDTSAQVPNQDTTPHRSNLSNVQGSDNHKSRSSDPLQAELDKLCELKDTIIKFHEDIMVKLKSDHEKELAEMIAQMNLKYETKRKDAEAKIELKKKEVDVCLNRVVKNKILAESFRSKCQDLNLANPAGIHGIQSREMQHLPQFHVRFPPYSPARSSGNHQVTQQLQPPLQIVHQPAELFSNPPSSTTPSSMPTRPPSTITPSSMPTRPPSTITPSSLPSRPQSAIVPNRPTSTPSRPVAPNISPITPSSRPPPPSINTTTTPSARNPRAAGEIRSPAPHIRPFRPSTSVSHDPASHRVISSQHASSSSPARPPLPTSLQTPPPLPKFHNLPRSLPLTSPLLTQASSSQPPAAVPSLSSWNPSEQIPPPPCSLPATSSSLPPMPSISISHTGLYSAPGTDILSLSALDLLMDMDKQAAGGHQQNMLPSPPEFMDLTEYGKEGGGSDPVCLSDDD